MHRNKASAVTMLFRSGLIGSSACNVGCALTYSKTKYSVFIKVDKHCDRKGKLKIKLEGTE